eukprot:CAMPEP_0185697016 /NCGR_PEP_ID=MMETSP1164-20130828/5487_1 /TAXON_ID=1104430 /ORGANISM="Chrysoreinhardia sp, Strain CCMP2950" /LENGTH=279 /DNA_ID=CAMNT_0028363907 /DNA_START=560 /DNA_END=1399 /DNA_ORIENTATION=+
MNLNYTPLQNLLEAVKTSAPDILVLCGPFVDTKHPAVAGNHLGIDDSESRLDVDAHTLFMAHFSWRLEELIEGNKLKTRVVIVPAISDACCERIYPQASIDNRRSFPSTIPSWDDEIPVGSLELPACVTSLPNPAMFQVNDVLVGVSSTDILFDLSHEELFFCCKDFNGSSGSRVVRLASHVIDQRSFYPLSPPGLALDIRSCEHLKMRRVPHLLLLPSKLAPFAQQTSTTLIVNPGYLTKGTNTGMIAKIVFNTSTASMLNSECCRVADLAHVEIVRI